MHPAGRGKEDRIPPPSPLQLFVKVILVGKIVRTAGHGAIIFIKFLKSAMYFILPLLNKQLKCL